MGNRVTFDYSKASCFISEAEVESMKKIVTDAKAVSYTHLIHTLSSCCCYTAVK